MNEQSGLETGFLDAAAMSEPVGITGPRLHAAFAAAAAWLERNAQAINAINVFPVPDGDTGSNMASTLRDTVASVGTGLQSAGEVSAAIARGALMAARGNSGVILSQLLRGFSEATIGLDRLDGAALARGLANGARTAYAAVERPLEGTILTVARAAAEATEDMRTSDPRAVLEAALGGARRALARTPDLLPVLKQAGVVDSGGLGLVVLLEGVARYLQGEDAPPEPVDAGTIDAAWLAQASADGSAGAARFGYCTEFLIVGASLEPASVREHVSSLGDSVVIGGDATALHVHLHTDDPGAALSYATTLGRLGRVKVEDMQRQHDHLVQSVELHDTNRHSHAAEPSMDGLTAPVAVVFVVSGQGLADVARSLGAAAIVSGGQTMNPSVDEILKSAEQLPARSVIVLPNNRNVILSAEQAAGLAAKPVRVVRTVSIPQGLSALLAFDPELDADAAVQAMQRAAATVRTVEVTHAARTTRVGDVAVHEGDAIGLLDGQLVVAAPTLLDALLQTTERASPASGGAVTLYVGEGVPPESAAEAERLLTVRFPEVEVQVLAGGQLQYPFIASVD